MMDSITDANRSLSLFISLFPCVCVHRYLLAFILAALWAAASIAGASKQMSNHVMLLAMVVVAVTVGMVGYTIGFHTLSEEILDIPLVKTVVAWRKGPWLQALVLVIAWPAYLVMPLISALNQCIRRCMRRAEWNSCVPPKGPPQASKRGDEVVDEDTLTMTVVVHRMFEGMKHWQWTNVLVKVHWWCVFYYVFSVIVAKLVVIFFAWLNAKLNGVPVAATTVIFYLVGLTMFLLPPVPGVPVYITGGILLVNSCLNDGWEFGTAIVFTSFICFMIKLNAIAMQQKLFGECMGSKSVKVRAAVGVNSTTIKAIRMILLKPGIHIAKVAILCGGPDWPTSVLTGILRLSLLQMLLGSLPVIFIVSPLVVGAAFLLRADENETFSAASTTILMIATILQLLSMMAAFYFVFEVAEKRHEEIAAMPDDEEVKKIDEKNALRTKMYWAKIDWDKRLPGIWKFFLTSSAVVFTLVMWGFFFAGDKCFRPVDVSMDINCPLKEDLVTSAEYNSNFCDGKPEWDTCAPAGLALGETCVAPPGAGDDGDAAGREFVCSRQCEKEGLAGATSNFMLDAGWLAHAFMLYSSLFFVVFKCFGAQIITGDSEDYLMDEVSRSSDAPDAQAWGAAEAGASPRRGTMQISTQVATAQPLAVVPPNRHAHQARKPPPI